MEFLASSLVTFVQAAFGGAVLAALMLVVLLALAVVEKILWPGGRK